MNIKYLLKMASSNKSKPIKQYPAKCRKCGRVVGFSLIKGQKVLCSSCERK